jgi:GDP-4-dehydro-6-deoxy-D-mannose reductase
VQRRTTITGGGGFVGQWLARELLRLGDDVWLAGLGQLPQSPILSRSERSAVQWRTADVRNDADLATLFAASRPDVVVHLAGISFVPDAEQTPAVAYDVNVGGCVRTIAAARAGKTDPLVLVVGSGTQYGTHPQAAMPLAETAEQLPSSVYAATKAAQEIAALQAMRAGGPRVICSRSFSHSGVGHPPVFLLPSLVRRAREAKQSGAPLRIGNDVIRDYLHVSDVARAYIALIDSGTPGEIYNVCSGEGVRVSDLAKTALEFAGANVAVETAADLQRSADMPVLIGSHDKLTAATGWKPTRTYRDIFADLFATE